MVAPDCCAIYLIAGEKFTVALPRPVLGPAHRVDGTVARDPHQPCGQPPAVGIEAGCTLPTAQKHVLHDLLRQLWVADDAQRDRIDQPAVALINRSQRIFATACHG